MISQNQEEEKAQGVFDFQFFIRSRREEECTSILRFPTGSEKDKSRYLPTFTSAGFDDLAEPEGGEDAGRLRLPFLNIDHA
jgi:hypothetical protein